MASSSNNEANGGQTSGDRAVPVLVVSARESVLGSVREALEGDARLTEIAGTEEASRLVEGGGFSVVVVDGTETAEDAERSCEAIASTRSAVSIVMLVDGESADGAVRALRAGASDVVAWPEASAGELIERVRVAHQRVTDTAGEDRRERLERLANQVTSETQAAAGGGAPSPRPLEEAYRELQAQAAAKGVAVSTELETLLRDELDIDGLLRTYLEYILGRVGSTNAAIYLPGAGISMGEGGDWTLGAYINYDLARDSAEMMLDQLATFVPESVAANRDLTRVPDERADEVFGEQSHWLAGQDSIVVSALDDPDAPEPECHAVLHLFRDPRSPFTEADAETFAKSAALFGKQMSRVIRVHHRGGPVDDGFGGFDADDGFAA
ncbi:MAG: hypothetical protein AAGI17_08965 [Planctomycetota bacterium]